ncbi:MAG: hypothetical protein ABI230_06060 [Aestuariivirga sp.]
MKKPTKKQSLRGSAAKPIELNFKIDAYSPETFPMKKLGEYMAKLGALLGEESYIHFTRLISGSTGLGHKVQFEAYPKIKATLKSINDGTASPPIAAAYRDLNKMLKDDNASAKYVQSSTSAVILKFPGALEKEEETISVRQSGSIMGKLLRVGGADHTAHIQLEIGDKRLSKLESTREIASKLGHYLYQTVRLHGEGRWRRDEYGDWNVEQFTVHSFDNIKDVKLSDALDDINKTAVDWGDSSLDDLLEMRGGGKH